MYRNLNALHLVATVQQLCQRIDERFPASGLSEVARELLQVAEESVARAQWLGRPFWILRVAVLGTIAVIVTLLVVVLFSIRVSPEFEGFSDLLQAVDAAVNEIILLSLALLFLVSMETRLKRGRALRALYELRSLAHVIDMHQLTKDPEVTLSSQHATPSSPRRLLTPFQLARYLDYCSELLSLASKVAALHVQHLRDHVVLDAVNDVESLAGGLSQKIWQKIAVLEMKLQVAAPPAEAGERTPPAAN
jgi:hypothetical protein